MNENLAKAVLQIVEWMEADINDWENENISFTLEPHEVRLYTRALRAAVLSSGGLPVEKSVDIL